MKKLIAAVITLLLLVGVLHHFLFGCIPPRKEVPPTIWATTQHTSECNIDKFIVKGDVVRYNLFCRNTKLWGER